MEDHFYQNKTERLKKKKCMMKQINGQNYDDLLLLLILKISVSHHSLTQTVVGTNYEIFSKNYELLSQCFDT